MTTKPKRIAAALLMLSFTACTSLQPVAEPAAYFAKATPKFVVVTTTEQDAEEPPLVLNRPRFDAGTISGFNEGETMAIPVTRVRSLMATQPDRKKTTVALVVGGLAVGAIAYLVATAGDGYNEYHCEAPCRGLPDL